MENHYSTLGVDRKATQAEIRKAYLKRMHAAHPDRTDRANDEAAWRKANAEAASLNEAYSILSDPHTRASYDASLESAKNSQYRTVRTTRYAHPGKRTKDNSFASISPNQFTEGRARFGDLPERTRNILLNMQETGFAHQGHISLGPPGEPSLGILLSLGWFIYFIYAANTMPWNLELAGLFLVLNLAAGTLLAHCIVCYILYSKLHMKDHLIVSRLYFIESKNGWVQWWPLLSIHDIQVTHQYVNFIYMQSEMHICFPSTKKRWRFLRRKTVNRFLHEMSVLQAQLQEHLLQNDTEYFVSNDDFVGFSDNSVHESTADKYFQFLRVYVITVVLIIIIFICAVFINMN